MRGVPCRYVFAENIECNYINRVGQNCTYIAYMAVYLVVSLHKIPYIQYTPYILFLPTLLMRQPIKSERLCTTIHIIVDKMAVSSPSSSFPCTIETHSESMNSLLILSWQCTTALNKALNMLCTRTITTHNGRHTHYSCIH